MKSQQKKAFAVLGIFTLFLVVALVAAAYIFMRPQKIISPFVTPEPQSSSTPSFTPQATPKVSGSGSLDLKLQGWIYPGPTTCSVARELETTVKVGVLKPEYFTVESSGELKFLKEEDVGCNGYSLENVAMVKKYSKSQYVTVSGRLEGMSPLVSDVQKRSQAVSTLSTFVKESGFSGVEIDFEDFSSWKKEDYSNYKIFLTELGTSLHRDGKQLMVAGPPTADALETSYYVWRYEDFNTLPVDHVVVMAYDYQADHGNGEPVAPNTWVQGIITQVKSKIHDHSKIIIGIPSYGYIGTVGEYRAELLTYEQAKKESGVDQAIRDPASYEMIWRSGNKVGVYQDQKSLQMKRALVESLGVDQISIWHIGGNAWF